MFLAKFVCENAGTIDYVGLNKNDELIGFSLDKDGIKTVHNDIINQFINSVCINDSCVEILDDTEGYNVYYDQMTKFKHYIKDGKEDFLMFLKNNGTVALMYESNDQQGNDKKYDAKTCFKIILGFVAVNAVVYCSSFGIATILSKYGLDTLKDYGYYRYIAEDVDVFNEDGMLDYYDPLEDNNVDALTVEEALQFINDSPNLTPEDKALLANEELLNDILPYYKGTVMAQDIKLRLNGIGIESNYAVADDAGNLEAGYYNPLEPSVLHVDDDFYEQYNSMEYLDDYVYGLTRKGIVTHEFVHLFQFGDDYRYLTETSAELMSEEYFDTTLETNYEEGVKSLKLLIDIIGPEPILKGVFGGDFSDLNNILANNLKLDDYDKLMEYFMYSPIDVADKESEIRQILCNLYENIYGQDIRDDKNILYDFIYGDYSGSVINQPSGKRYYLNKSRMGEKEIFSINSQEIMLIEPDNDYIEDGTVYYRAKNVIDYENWSKNYKDADTGAPITYYCESRNVERAPDGENYYVYSMGQYDPDTGKIIKWNDNPMVVSLDEALRRGFVSAGIEFITTNNELAEGQEWCYDENGEIQTLRTYRSKTGDDIYYQYNDVFITVPGIKERFNVNTDVNASALAAEVATVNTNTSSDSVKITR